MKNAILSVGTENLVNIGDYIQALAASQFFEKIDVFIEREELNKYEGDVIRIIMNGWFMHHPENWPPSDKIIPYFIAFHINASAKKQLLSPESVAYFKKHEPIGCRDWYTTKLLAEKGINSYFSACLTLSLGKSYCCDEKERTNNVYIVDPYLPYYQNIGDVLSAIGQAIKKIRVIPKIMRIMHGNKLKAFVKAGYFYKIYKDAFAESILDKAIYLTHEYDYLSHEQSLSDAEALIRAYSTAKLVITSRIHCALPCTGLNTPAIYIHNGEKNTISDCRLDGILDFLNVWTLSEKGVFSISSKITEDTIVENKPTYLQYKQQLISACEKFVHESFDNHSGL